MIFSDQDPLLFVGLGNPGIEYEKTRHNIGYLVVQALASKMGWSFHKDNRFMGLIAKGRVGNRVLHLILPTTYMNRSGMSVKSYVDFFKLSTIQLVVVVDDSALPFGQFRLKSQGTSGGHNGLRSIQSCLATSHYPRLRIGIGAPGKEETLADYVLSSFNEEELKSLGKIIEEGTQILLGVCQEGLAKQMNKVNQTFSLKPGEERESKSQKE